MKTISGKVISSKPISLSKAAKFLNKFVSSETSGAPEAVSRFLRRSSVSFNELVQFHRGLKTGNSGRKGMSQLEASENRNIKVEDGDALGKGTSFIFGEETSYVENGGGSHGERGGKKKTGKKKSETKAEDEENEVGKHEKVDNFKSSGFEDERTLRRVGASDVERSGKKKNNSKKSVTNVYDEERGVGKSEEANNGKSLDLGEEKSLKSLENGGGGSDGQGIGKKKKNKKKSEFKCENEEREVVKPEKVVEEERTARKKRKKVEDDESRSLDGSEERHGPKRKKRRHDEEH